ncbi:hypothetical protein MycrhDRAFT_5748 [Mycolicibacterium rhodesiae JS60]|nr:hypothetical protein MycrhDRAFT_5748 [Mycolicibacterium rhodesiae JS60]
MSGKRNPASYRPLDLSTIEAYRKAGLNQTEIAEMHGVSRQAVSWHKTTYGGLMSTRQIVDKAWPWETTRAQGASVAFQRLRDHGEYMATGGRGMSESKIKRYKSWLNRMRENDWVVEFDPNIPPTPKVAPNGGFAYRPRDPKIDGYHLLIRVNEFTNLTPEGKRIWRYKPGESPHETQGG